MQKAQLCRLQVSWADDCMQIRRAIPGVQRVLFGAFGVPFGLALIIICGADLFTANICFVTAALFEARTGPIT